MDFSSFLGGLLSGTIVPIVIELIRKKPKKQVETETDVSIAEAAEKIVSGSSNAVEMIERLLARYDARIQSAEDRNKEYERQLQEASERADRQGQEINNLKARITSLQIEGQEKERIERERNHVIVIKFEALIEYVEVLRDIFRERGIQVPEPKKILTDRDTQELLKAIKDKGIDP